MNQQRHAQKSNSRLNSFQWGSKLVGHPVFFLLGPSSFELTPREGKRIGHTTTQSLAVDQATKPSASSPSSPLLMLLAPPSPVTKQHQKSEQQKQYSTPTNMFRRSL